MAVTTVAPGGTLGATLTAASAGDVIVLQTGEYTGNVTFKPGVHVIAAPGAVPVLSGVFGNSAGSTRILLRDLTFTSTGLNTLGNNGKIRFDHCKFLVAGNYEITGDDTGTFEFYGCTFITEYTNFRSLGATDVHIGCLYVGSVFFDTHTDTTLSWCTFANPAGAINPNIRVESGTITATNCIFSEPNVLASQIYLVCLAVPGTATRCVFLENDDANPYTSGGMVEIDCRYPTGGIFRSTGSWRLAEGSVARNIGGTAGAPYPFGANRLALGPDAGCFTYYGDTTAVFAPWLEADPAFGFDATDVTKGLISVIPDLGLRADIFDVGQRLAFELTKHFVQPEFVWGVSATGELELRSIFQSTTGDLTTSALAIPHFGILSETGITDLTLRADPRILLTDLAWEAPTAPFIPAVVERYDMGQTRGSDIPDANERRLCSFRLYTRTDENYAHDVRARTVFNRWSSGSPVRVYRRWDETDPWSTTNVEGYDDIVPLRVDGMDYQWYTPNLTSYEIVFEGVAKDRSLP